VKKGRSKGARSVFSGEQSCQVATLDLAHRILGYRRNQVDLLGHFEIGQARPTEHLEFWRGDGTSQYHGGRDFFAILGVRYSENRSLGYRRML
jgi:hypothetical protein